MQTKDFYIYRSKWHRLLSLVLACLVVVGKMEAQKRGSRLLVLDEQKAPLIGVTAQQGSRGTAGNIKGYIDLSLFDLSQPLRLSYVGFEERSVLLDTIPLKGQVYTLILKEQTLAIQENVIVTGERRDRVAPSVIAAHIGTERLRKSVGFSLAKVLEDIGGVSSIRTGTSADKPVLHGMHSNRLPIIVDGVRQTGQAWNQGHAPEVDISATQHIYVAKGAEGVRYGAEAMGGAIVLKQRTLPYLGKELGGHLTTSYETNGRRYLASGMLEGGIPLKGFAWRLQAMHSNGGDHHTPNYLLNNTAERTTNISLLLGYQLAPGLHIEGGYTRYSSRHGVLRSAQLGNVSIFRERIALGRPHPSTITPFSRQIDYPYEEVEHNTWLTKASYHWRQHRFTYQLSYQTDKRQEYRYRRAGNHIPEVYLSLTSLQHRLSLESKWRGGLQNELGMQYYDTHNESIPGTGVVPAIPNYVERRWGIYDILRYERERLRLEAGARLDIQTTKSLGYDRLGTLYGGERKFSNLSYNLGANYKLGKDLELTSSFGAAWRAPHVHELYADGSDHGSAMYLLGNPDIESERSYKWITSLDWDASWIHLKLDAYLQWIDGYIYDEPQLSPSGEAELRSTLQGVYPIFAFKQTDAFFRGFDLHLELVPIQGLRYSLTTTLLFANERQNNAYLPFIPPLRISQSLRYQFHAGNAWRAHIQLGHQFTDKQTRFEPSRDLINFTPDAYQLLSAELGLQYTLSSRYRLTANLSGENLLDTEYKEYTDRARYYSHALGRSLRLTLGLQF